MQPPPPPSYGPPPGPPMPPGPPAGPPGPPPGMGPSGPRRSNNNAAAAVIIIVVAAVVVLVGGAGLAWWLLADDDDSRGRTTSYKIPNTLPSPTLSLPPPPTYPTYTPPPRSTYTPRRQYYGAIAVAPDGSIGKSWDYSNGSGAEQRALKECRRSDCKVLVVFVNGCGAVAYNSKTSRYWGGRGDTRTQAQNNAISNAGGGRTVAWVCTTRYR